jgi:TRAP-type C4-dicarboxylate transport system substrate-binding protein
MKKDKLFVNLGRIFVSLFFVSLLFFSYSKVEAANPKPITLKVVLCASPTGFTRVLGWDPFKKAVEQRSGGRLIIELYPGETLVKYAGTLDAVLSGVTQIAEIPVTYWPGRFTLSEICSLPKTAPTAEAIGEAYYKLGDKYFKAEMERFNLHLIGNRQQSPYWLISPKKPIQKIDDLKGLNIRSPGGPATVVIKNLKARAITMTAADAYEALQKGTLDVGIHSRATFKVFKWFEIGSPGYLLDVGGMGGVVTPFVVRGQVWKSLSKDLQQILEEEGWAASQRINKENDRESEDMKPFIDKGIKISKISGKDEEAFKAATKFAYDDWLAKTKAANLPGEQLLKDFLKIIGM